MKRNSPNQLSKSALYWCHWPESRIVSLPCWRAAEACYSQTPRGVRSSENGKCMPEVFPKVLCGIHILLLQSLLLPSFHCHLTFQQSTAWHSDHVRHSVTQASKLMAWETCYLLPLICHNICQVSMWLIFELFLLYPTNLQGLLLKNSASWLKCRNSASSTEMICM